MNEYFKTELLIVDAGMYLHRAVVGLSSLETKLSDISVKLGSKAWEGDAKEKCVDIHNLIIRYKDQLKPQCDVLKTNCQELLDDVKAFDSQSENVKQLKSIAL